jgi:diguanylate cyclase (GGDEF)-like protein
VKKHHENRDRIYNYIKEHLYQLDDIYSASEIDAVHEKVLRNTEAIFFYLEREAYSDALIMVINILELYKITLVLDNLISNIVVKKAQKVIDEKERLSNIDPLTNVMNRRKFKELLESLVMRSHKTSVPLAIAIFDIDDFKLINDQYGHPFGDKVLVELSSLISNSVRQQDHIIRYGGEEFVVISSDTTIEGVYSLAEKIRQNIAKNLFDSGLSVTVSSGVTTLSPADDVETFLKRADDYLYHAKREGKNRIYSGL